MIADLDAFLARSGIEAVPVDVAQMRTYARVGTRIRFAPVLANVPGRGARSTMSWPRSNGPLLWTGRRF